MHTGLGVETKATSAKNTSEFETIDKYQMQAFAVFF